MSTIVPAILEQTFQEFSDKNFILERIPGVERIHVDFADGVFVNNRTVPAADMELLNPAFHYEAHIMVQNPTDFMDYHIAGFKTVIVHYEAYTSEQAVDTALSEIAKLSMVPVLAINPETPVSVLRYFGDTINHFLVMSVTPGQQGNSFVATTPQRIQQLRELLPHVTIEVDGGINSGNAKKLVDAGADLLVVGSAIVKTSNPAASFLDLETALLTENKTQT